MAARTHSPQMATRPSPWVEARNRVSNDHTIRINENLTDHESKDLLAFAHGRAGGSVPQPCEKILEVLSQLLGKFPHLPDCAPQIFDLTRKLAFEHVRFVRHAEPAPTFKVLIYFPPRVTRPGDGV